MHAHIHARNMKLLNVRRKEGEEGEKINNVK